MSAGSALTQSEPEPRIFVSGTIEGFRKERASINKALRDLGLDPWVFEQKPGSSQPVHESYVSYVGRSERLIWIVEGPPSEAVVEEIQEALLLEVPILAFVIGETDELTRKLLGASGTKYTPTDRASLVEAVRMTLIDEMRRGIRRPHAGAGAGEPPAPPEDFVGRESELRNLSDSIHAGKTVVVNGLPGVGKSALAQQAAAQAEFERKLYLDLRSAERPAAAETSLRHLLIGLGQRNASLPSDLESLNVAWQRATSESSVLVVVDDATAESEVRPLIPAGRGAALITARQSLPALDATQVPLHELTEERSTDLLKAVLGHGRIAAEPVRARHLLSSVRWPAACPAHHRGTLGDSPGLELVGVRRALARRAQSPRDA